MASLAFDYLERELEREMALANLLAPLQTIHEVDRRWLSANGYLVIEKEMSNGTFRVFIDGFETSWSYEECIAWAKGKMK